jgi:hypothetical protein
MKNLIHYNPDHVKNGFHVIQFAYYLAVLGMLMAFVLSFRSFFACWKCAEALALLALTLLGLLVQTPGEWSTAYYFGRILAPLLVLLALEYFPTGNRWKLLPACMVSPAILLVSVASAIRLVRHL